MPSGHRPQPPVGTARVAISGLTAGSNTWVNVLWLNLTSTTHVAADIKSVVDSMLAAYVTRFGAYISSECTIAQASASWLYASNTVLEYTGTNANAPTGAATNVTDAVSAMINWSITDYYRGGHPRTYLPGVPSAQIANANFLNSTYRTNVNTAASNFLTDVNALTHGGISAVALGTVRFASGNAWLSPPVFKAYQAAGVRSRVAIQKRRLGGR